MEKVLIFGGTGFIGLSLAKHLKEKGMIPVLIARNNLRNHWVLSLENGMHSP